MVLFEKPGTENTAAALELAVQAAKKASLDIVVATTGGGNIPVLLDPRQEQDYDRGLCYFLENIPAKQVYPMHYWEKSEIIGRFLDDHPKYQNQIQYTERGSL